MISRRTALVVAQTLLGAGLLAAWFSIVDLEQVGATLRQARWTFVLLAGSLGIASTFVRSVRWRLILRPIATFPLVDLWLISVASSLINFVIPIRSGELARSLFLKQRRRAPISATLPTVAVDRSLDLLAVLSMGAIGALTGRSLGNGLSMVLVLGGVLLLAFAAFVLLAIGYRRRLLDVARRMVPNGLGREPKARILGLLEGFLAGFSSIGRNPRNLGTLIGLSFAAGLLDALVFFILFAGLGTILPPRIVITGYALFVLTFLVPGAPGYVGSMEAFGSLVFGALGVAETMAASMVVLFHALNAAMLGISGGLALWALGLRPTAAVRSILAQPETLTEAANQGS